MLTTVYVLYFKWYVCLSVDVNLKVIGVIICMDTDLMSDVDVHYTRLASCAIWAH